MQQFLTVKNSPLWGLGGSDSSPFFLRARMEAMLKIIDVAKIKPGRNIRVEYDNEVRELAQSINKNGLLNPITVERSAGGFYEVVAGHRRFQALKILNEPFIECNVLENTPTEKERLSIQLQENACRKDMSAFEYVELFDKLRATGMTQEQIARLCGKSQGWVATQYQAKKRLEEMAENGDLSYEDMKMTATRALKKYNDKVAERDRIVRFTHSPHNFRIQVYNMDAERELLEYITEWRKKWQS